jgi:hypothetical protein
MHPDSSETQLLHSQADVTLDGLQVTLPKGRRSLAGIRSYLETIALEQQRFLCSFSIDGEQIHLSRQLTGRRKFHRVEANSITLDELPLQILKAAYQQAEVARERVESALTLVLINNGCAAREVWWELVKDLKEPVLTLSLLPDNICGPAEGRASFTQMRKWQLEQIAAIVKDVDEAASSEDPIVLSNALENRVLPWLRNLSELVILWHETVFAGIRLGSHYAG